MTLLERGPVLDRLDDLLSQAREGSGKTVLIHGGAGIGKTSVVRAFIEIHESGAHILKAGCDDLLATRPLAPVWDIAADEPQLTSALEEENRFVVFRAIMDLLERALRPTILVIEDLHWADDASLDLIKYVGRRIDQTHGLLILTYRDTELTIEHPLRVLIGDLPQEHLERIELQPLSKEAVGQLATDEFQVDRIWEVTRGNPFFVSELMGSGSGSVPDSIKDSIRTRWSRLGRAARGLVDLVSVAPGKLRMAIVQDILGDITNLIREGEDSGILQLEGETLRFRHELARQVIEEDLDELRRRDLNRSVLEACESLGEDLSRCAHHARQAMDEEAMLRLLPEAAQQASDMNSHREALAHLRALEPLLNRMSARDRAAHYQLWAFEEYADNPARAEEIGDQAVAQARLAGDPVALGRALVFASRIKWANTRRAAAVSLAEEAAEVLEKVGGEDLALAYASLSGLAMLASDYDDTLHWADLALEFADDGPSPARAQALVNRGSMVAAIRFPEGVEDLEEAYRIGTEHDIGQVVARAINNLTRTAILWRRIDLAEPWLRLGFKLSREREWRTFRFYMEAALAQMEEMTGNWTEAEARTGRLLDEKANHTIPELEATSVRARLLVRMGHPDASDLVADVWDRTTETEEFQQMAQAGSIIAEHLWLGADVEDDLLKDLVALVKQSIELDLGWYGGELAQYLVLVGAIDEVPAAMPDPYVALDRGAWEEAAEFWEERSLPYDQGVALSRGDVEAKLKALEILDRLGAAPLSSRLRRELREAGVHGIPRGPRRATVESPLGLTPRQTEVLELLDQDLSNEEIANRLTVSIRTVENHVSAILTKLEARDRKEAVELAREAEIR